MGRVTHNRGDWERGKDCPSSALGGRDACATVLRVGQLGGGAGKGHGDDVQGFTKYIALVVAVRVWISL
jgi:hypothetical protein